MSDEAALTTFLQGHHFRVTPKNSEPVNVFVIGGSPVFGKAGNNFEFQIELFFAGIIWVVKGFINKSNNTIQAFFSIRIPFFGTYDIGTVEGNLNNGIGLTWDITGFTSGSGKFYVNNDWLTLDLTVVVFEESWETVTITIFPFSW